MSRQTDRLINEAIALVRGALRRDQIDFKKVMEPVETNLFTSEQIDRYTSEVIVAERAGWPNTTTNQENWLDTERANMRSRVSAFKERQQRFQREREEFVLQP